MGKKGADEIIHPQGPCWSCTKLISDFGMCKICYNYMATHQIQLSCFKLSMYSYASQLTDTALPLVFPVLFMNVHICYLPINRLIYTIVQHQQFLYCCTSNFNKPTWTRQGMKHHSPTTNLRIRYCKMVAKSESWSELSSERDRESLSSILLEVEVPIQTKIFNTSYDVKRPMEYKHTTLVT